MSLRDVVDAVNRQANAEQRAALNRGFGEDWDASPIGKHRDSGVLDVCNFDVIKADLKSRFPDAPTCTHGADCHDTFCGRDWDTMTMGHWGVGWVECIVYRRGTPAAEAVAQWVDALADYPIADESAYSAAQREEATELVADLIQQASQDIDYKCIPECASNPDDCTPACKAQLDAQYARGERMQEVQPETVLAWLNANSRDQTADCIGYTDVQEALSAILDGWTE